MLVSGGHNETLGVISPCDGYKKNGGRLAEMMFRSIGSVGGHREATKAEVPLRNPPVDVHDFTTATLTKLAIKHLQ